MDTEASPGAIRARCRSGHWLVPTSGHALGFAQANLVVLPRSAAYDFVVFCQRNPRSCPLLEVTDPGDAEPRALAPGADLRTDLPMYRVYREGQLVDEPHDLLGCWRADSVAFLLGCSFTFESALHAAGLELRHWSEGKNVPMYRTNRLCRPAGTFAGPLVVSMRPFSAADAIRAIEITARFPRSHGAPVHLGDPAALGIADLGRPDYGDAVTVKSHEVPVFWACGVTPQAVAIASRLPLVITHAPGHMFVTDIKDSELEAA